MNADSTIKNILFVVFFGAGICSVFFSILCDEILNYYQIKISREQTAATIEEIVEMDRQTSELVKDIEENPEIVERLGPLKFGTEPNHPNAIEIHLRESELREVQEIIEQKRLTNQSQTEIPLLVKRCVDPTIRQILFFAGSGLILVSFSCFRVKPKNI